MGLINIMRDRLRSFLRIEPPQRSTITIQQRLDYYANAAKNRIWYRGSSYELSQLYQQLDVSPTMFWKASCTRGMEIHKIHTGLPKLIVDTLANIIINDFNGIDFTNSDLQKEIWESTYKANKGDKLLRRCIKNMLVVGDGAFKITFDEGVDSEYPIVEFYAGENVEYERTRGRITEVIFLTEYIDHKRKYTLKEHYGYGYIKYCLYNESGTEVPPNSIEQTKWIDGKGVSFDESLMLAVPCIFGDSEQYEGRGSNIFDGKTDDFDALDEAWSQWLDALRASRSKEYIPECLIPRNPEAGGLIKPNAFDNRFIAICDDKSETGVNKIILDQPTIPHESYLQTYVTALDLCLQGIISPSTLGIDVKKMDNAEAQREKEKTTLYTRGNLVQLVEEFMPELVKSVVCGYQLWHELDIIPPTSAVNFGEYANPSFEAVVETVTKAKQGGIMSLESCVEELYGDSRDGDWKEQEIARLKSEQGVQAEGEPSMTEDLKLNDIQEFNVTEPQITNGTNKLNGAQITSLLSIIQSYTTGAISRNAAISITTSTLGISREDAENFIEEHMMRE